MTLLYSATYSEADPFGLFNSVVPIQKATQMEEKDAVLILWGGEDIGTSIYNQKPNRMVSAFKPSMRDIEEMRMIETAVDLDIPIIGVCRGAQLLCCMAGGKLVQHIEDHGRSHKVTLHDENDAEVVCNSSHHQMMWPGDCQHQVLASSEGVMALNEYSQPFKLDRVNEVVYFPAICGLGIQPHPEWTNCPHEFIDYCVRKISQYLLNKEK